MSLEAILAAIRQGGQQQVEEIETHAQQRAEAILDAARREACVLQVEAREQAARPAYRERARIMHRTRLEALRTEGAAREKNIEAALAQSRLQLAQLRGESGFADIQRKLTVEALHALEGSPEDMSHARLQVDPRDAALMTTILKELDLDLAVDTDLTCWGGLIAHSEDGCITVINTFESRLQRAMPVLRHNLAYIFEEGESTRTASTTVMHAFAR